MTDPYENIRKALEMGPTPGPWAVNPGMAQVDAMPSTLPVCKLLWPTTKRTEAETWANGQLIATCDPDTIRELLAERDQLDAALEAARADAERLAFLAIKLVVEGFVGGEKHIYDYACDAAEESGRDEPSEADMLAGLRRMIDAAIDQARGKENGNG